MSNRRLVLLLVAAASLFASRSGATNVPQTLPFAHNWTDITLINVDGDWSLVPGILGFRGDNITGVTGADPQTLLAEDSPGVNNVEANETNPTSFATGGVAEFHITDPTIALNGSGTADAPYVRLHLVTTGCTGIQVSYNLRDLDGSADNAIQPVALHYRAGTTGTFTNVAGAFVADATTGGAATLVTPVSVTLPAAAENLAELHLRIMTANAVGNDEWVGVDDISVTGTCGAVTPNLNIGDVGLAEGDAPGTTVFTFVVSLTADAPAGGVTFDIATADGTAQDGNPLGEDNDYVAQSLTGQSIATGTGPYNFSVLVNHDTTVEPNETFFVNVTNIVGANAGDTQGQGTITNDDATLVFIHDVQGPGAATPIPGTTVAVEGVVIGDYQVSSELSGFFLEEEDVDFDADPATSEGIFIFCSGCPTAVAEGQRVRVTGAVSEFFNMTEITATTAGSVVVTEAGNHLAEVTPAPIDLPVAGVVNDFYEAREGMRVTFVDTLTVSEYFELARFGHLELYEGGRPRQFTEASPPSPAGLVAHLDNLDRRRVILDDTTNRQNSYLPAFGGPADGSQFIFHPRANGGFSVGTQGTDFFRGGDLVSGLTGVLHWSFPGNGADTWRIRPAAATPATFTAANPRPATPPAVGGAIQAASMNLLNYFTTIDTTASTTTGPCGPSATLDCRGADSVAELNRQRERASIVICDLDADVVAFMELENTTPSATITDLLGAVNARCGGANPYAFVNTGGTLGTDAIRVQLIYRSATISPVGAPLVDLDPIHNRPPTAQTFDVVDPANPVFGQRFTVIANHFKSKGCPGTGGDDDLGDGQGCFNATRVAQANRLLTWINSTVLPAAGDPDVLLLGDFNAYAEENPVTTIEAGGFTDLESALLGPAAYSYLFDGQLGHLDYAFSSASLTPQVTGVGAWHINADEAPLFDFSDEIFDSPGEANFEEKPDGSTLVPPRVVFQPASPYRASDHDPVLVGLFQVADLSITKTDSPDPVAAGSNLTYTITVTNSGPDAAATTSWSDTLPIGTTFVSLPAVAGWTCLTPAVGSGGQVSCSNPSFAVGANVFTLTVHVDATVSSGSVLSNTAAVTSTTGDPDTADRSATATTTVTTSADLSITKSGSPDPVTAGTNLTYSITITNAGPSAATPVTMGDILPPGTTFVSVSAPAGWSCTTPPVGGNGTVSCSVASFAPGTAGITLVVHVASSVAAGTLIQNTAAVTSSTGDPNPGNETFTTATTVTAPTLLEATKTVGGNFEAGGAITYTVEITNLGPADQLDLAGDEFTDVLPPELVLVSATATSGTAVASLGTNTVTWNGVIAAGASVTITIEATIDPGALFGTVVENQGTLLFDGDGDGANEATAPTDDPAQGGAADPTTFTVGSRGTVEIPTLGEIGLVALALLLAAAGTALSRRRAGGLHRPG